jgi:hypothetical protein
MDDILVTTTRSRSRAGQASLEMAAAIVATLLLLAGSIKLVLWGAERYYTRLRGYDATRASAASIPFRRAVYQRWDDSYEPKRPLNLVD